MTPRALISQAKATAVAAGARHTCALNGGSPVCWGANDTKQANPKATTTADVTIPVAVQDMGTVVAVAAGGDHTCAVVADGKVKCWGALPPTTTGAITDIYKGTSNDAKDGLLTDMTGVSAGEDHACAFQKNASAWCWGSNTLRQLGNNNSASPVTFATAQQLATTFTQGIGAGTGHTCLLRENAGVLCSGDNSTHQCPPGTDDLASNAPSFPPEAAPLPEQAQLGFLDVGDRHSCVVETVNGAASVYCWGDNTKGQLGSNADAGPALVEKL